jgi:hypothetical protein
MAEHIKRDRETHYAVPEFWVYAYVSDPNVAQHTLYRTDRLTPEQAQAALAQREPVNNRLPDPDYPGIFLPWTITLLRATWRDRETLDQSTTERKGPVWYRQQWWGDHVEIWQSHFPLVSREDPKMLSYYQSPEKAAMGVRTRIRPGRYLTKYFREILTEKQIAQMARWQETGTFETDYHDAEAYPLLFATTAKEIRTVYEDGPASCMSGSADNYYCDGWHPSIVYAAGDLAIAYIKEAATGNIRARALVWPARKIVGRVYPTPDSHWAGDGFASQEDAEAMQHALHNRLLEDGYQDATKTGQTSFNGARLRKIELYRDDRYLMPYLDQGYKVNDCGDHFEMHQHGDIGADGTEGHIEIEDDRPTCDRCAYRVDEDDLSTVYLRPTMRRIFRANWCPDCVADHAFICDGSGALFDDSVDAATVDGNTYTVAYCEAHFSFSDYSHEWFEGARVLMDDGDVWSQEEFDEYGFTDRITGGNYSLCDEHKDYPGFLDTHSAEEIEQYLAAHSTKEMETNQ